MRLTAVEGDVYGVVLAFVQLTRLFGAGVNVHQHDLTDR